MECNGWRLRLDEIGCVLQKEPYGSTLRKHVKLVASGPHALCCPEPAEAWGRKAAQRLLQAPKGEMMRAEIK